MTDLSVVVPSVNGWDDLEGCLQALNAQRTDVELEVLVVDRCGDAVRRSVEEHYPWVRLLPATPGTPIPVLRALAFEQARGDAVSVIEDHVLVPEGWARQLLEALGRGERVVGGSVENAATERLVDWAAFLCEYSHLLPPLPEGPVDSLPGNNTVYHRSVLVHYRSVIQEAQWEHRLHEAMRRDGVELISQPEIRVGHKRHYSVWSYAQERFWYSRSYAGGMSGGSPAWQRLLRGARALLLPPVLYARIVMTVWSKGAHRKELLLSLPLLGVFVTVWGLGEVVGHWAGAGDSLSKVR